MKHILVILDELFPVRGAPQVRIHNLLAALPSWEKSAIGGKLAEDTPPENFTLLNRPSERNPLKFLIFLQLLGYRAKKFAARLRPDIIVISVPKYEMLAFAPALSRFTKKLVLDFRDSLAFLNYSAYLAHFLPAFLASPLGNFFSWINKRLQLRAIKSASLITVANEGIKAGISHPNIFVVPNGVDTDSFSPNGKVFFNGNAPLKLVYLGNFAEKDRFDWLTALKTVQNFEIHLIGEGRNRAKVEEALKGSPAVFHGSVPHEKLPEVLLGMDLGFIIREQGVDQSIPVCLFEFAAMNIPSICNDTGIMAQFVKNNGIGFIASDESQFATIIKGILSEPEKLKSFRGLHDTAEKLFSLRSSREKFAALFN